MTIPELEGYITRNLPVLRRKCITYGSDDADLLQLALIDLLKNHECLLITGDKQFIDLAVRYCSTWRFRRRATMARERRYNNFTGHYHINRDARPQFVIDYDIETRTQEHPFDNIKVNALEYLELVTNPRTYHIMYMYYIEGYTLAEIAKDMNLGVTRVFQVLEEGVEEIKRFTAAM